MTGAILQLQTEGVENLLLTHEPDINVFKYTYYKYINFSSDIVRLNLNETATFGRNTSCTIFKKGHLLSKLYLQLVLPPLQNIDGTYLSWADTIGYNIFNGPIELLVDGVVIDRIYPTFMDIWDELSIDESKRKGRNLMILKSDVYRSNIYNAHKQNTLMIPLEFWFTKEYSLSLPLLSLWTDDIKINFGLKQFNECVNYDGSILPPITSCQIIDSSVFAEYIWIDNPFIDMFKTNEHFYIINQAEYHGDEIISAGATNYTTRLKFSNPSKELFVTCVDIQNVINNNNFNYSRSDENPFILSVNMYLDGSLRYDNIPEFYFRCMYPDSVHECIPDKYIYTIPFSLKPEENQPTGCLSMSRFSDITLNFTLNNNNPSVYLHIYSLMYNFLTIRNGRMFFQFAI